MSEHRIRFRGGWEFQKIGADAGPIQRFSLPTRWDATLSGEFRLTRRFQNPSIDRSTESLWLELRNVPGIEKVLCNGHELRRPSEEPEDGLIPLVEKTLPRNELTLEVQLGPDLAPEHRANWGEIALVILTGPRPLLDP